MRNPVIQLNGHPVQLIGDPHLGRKFDTNTPLDRRGEREEKQIEQFRSLVQDTEPGYVIIMGDLFDRMKVSNEILESVRGIIEASEKKIFIIMGNHDASRDKNLVSSYHLLMNMLTKAVFVTGAYLCEELDCVMIGYHPFIPPQGILESLGSCAKEGRRFQAFFTHNDVDSFGGADFNLMAFSELEKWTDTVYNGHIHRPETRKVGNLTVHNIGSMQPYAHGEQLDGEMYVSITPEEYLKDPESNRDKCLRFLLKPGERIPDGANALNITSKLVLDDPEGEQEQKEVKFEDFDFQQLFITALKDRGVGDVTIENLWGRYQEMKNVEQD